MTRRRRQQGFTLIELMVASTIGLILLAAIGGVLSDALRTAAALNSQVAINRHAREVFEFLAHGGSNENANANAVAILPFKYVFGLRGRNPAGGTDPWRMPVVAATQSPYMARSADGGTRLYRFALARDGAVPLASATDALFTETIQDITVACTGEHRPVQGCAVAQSAVMQGFLRSEPSLYVEAQRGGLATVAVQLIDPRVQGAPRAYDTEQTITVWTAFTGLQEVSPWQ